jgi:uncharacterized protein
MRTQQYRLPAKSGGTQRELLSLHFGSVSNGRKVYIQSALHADEIPGMLVAHYLRQSFERLELSRHLLSEIVLVPCANPIGLAQDIQGTAFGRFDLSNGINFNRNYAHLTADLIAAVKGKLSSDADANVKVIRAEAMNLMQKLPALSETEFLKKTLQSLAIDADIVLDLHCDNQAVVHLYAGTPLVDIAQKLTRFVGGQALLLCEISGDNPFDESCSRHWWELAAHFGAETPIPPACAAITMELRGETEVSHALAIKDAAAIVQFLQSTGDIAAEARVIDASPELLCVPTPLEGVEPLTAPHAGVLVFTKELGDDIVAGQSIGDIVDPIVGTVTPLVATVSGKLFARVARRYVYAGMRVAKIAGAVAYRSGNLLSL